jgi:hypothetical protein
MWLTQLDPQKLRNAAKMFLTACMIESKRRASETEAARAVPLRYAPVLSHEGDVPLKVVLKSSGFPVHGLQDFVELGDERSE